MYLYDLIPHDDLWSAVNEGYIRRQVHPDLSLEIYNYTEKAQFARHWNVATLNARGLIVDSTYGDILARPFPKFFNYGETEASKTMSLDEPIEAYDKLDGSLGILYPFGYKKYAIATRGSFTSDQAIHATKIWNDRYRRTFDPGSRYTFLFEIIYPENRIVVDYKGLDDLVLLGGVDNQSGTFFGPEFFPHWLGLRANKLPHRTLRQAVTAKPRDGKEGMVIRSLMDGLMLKIKQEDYVRLHRIVTGLNEKEIWRRCVNADLDPEVFDRMGYVLQDIPDELHEWVRGVVVRLAEQVLQMQEQVALATAATLTVGGPRNRGDFARRVQQHTDLRWLRSALFLVYDRRDFKELLWKQIEPKGDTGVQGR